MYECVDALLFIHSKDHIHNDLKGENMIVSDVNNSLQPLSKLAFSCINGSPEKRNTTKPLVAELQLQYTTHVNKQ